jgi:hypothetical protein
MKSTMVRVPLLICLLLLTQIGVTLAEDDDSEDHPTGTLYLPPIRPGEVLPLVDAYTGMKIKDYAARVGLPASVREGLLAYCNEMGITQKFLELMEHPLETSDDGGVTNIKWTNKGITWGISRPEKHWFSNMHWLEPYDPDAERSMLTALGDSGFDEVFDAIGEFFDLETLTGHSLSFVAVTHATQKSYLHHDFTETGGKGFNIIVPLLVVDGSPPELEVADEDGVLYALPYDYHSAAVVGDDALHRTSAVDYRDRPGQMRMAATIYCGDINEENVEQFMKEYTPHVPELTEDELLEKRGLHWGNGARLPRTNEYDEEEF